MSREKSSCRDRARVFWPRPVKSSRWPGVFIFSERASLSGRVASPGGMCRNGARRRRAQRPAPEPTAMATDVDADASMSALRAKYDATTKLLAAQCDTVDRLRAEVRALRRAPEGKEPFGEYARGCSPSVAGDVASDYESKYRRAKKFVKTQVRGGADARTTTRATVRPLATTSSPPPREERRVSRVTPRRTPPRDSRALLFPSPSSPARRSRSPSSSNARNARRRPRRMRTRAPAPRTHPSTRFANPP